jgi:serine/threonine-protein kinase HipA
LNLRHRSAQKNRETRRFGHKSQERIGEAIQETTREVHSYTKEHPEFAGIGQRMLQEWESGVNTSLRG